MSFDTLGLSQPILDAIAKMGFVEPTPVQSQVIPRLLANEGDLVALAQTGTGKTAAFGLPILSMLDHKKRAPQAIILCPTRELCIQIARDLKAYAACSPAVSTLAIYGGAPIYPQLKALQNGVQVIVATPGRMLDVLRRGKVDLSGIERIILDEADEMLNMGFKEDLEAILTNIPEGAHTLLFSATMPRSVEAIAKNYMHEPEQIVVGQRNSGADTVSHDCYVVHERDRYAALKRIADLYPDTYAIVFCRTRQDTQHIADRLIKDGYNADALHGDLSQAQRDSVMEKFRSKHLQLLVATDVAARGLDVSDLTHVINYNLPDELASYTHRSGRTGRAGKKGVSALITNMREKGKTIHIEKMIGKKFNYRDVPSGRDICEAQLLSMIERMKSVDVAHDQIELFMPSIFESLKGMSWEEVVKRFVSLEFTTLLKYYRDAPDLSAHPAKDNTGRQGNARDDRHSKQPNTRLFVNIGSAEGVGPKDLMGMINRHGGSGVQVGRIDIMKKHSFFDVPEEHAAALILALGMAEHRGHRLQVEIAEETEEGQRKHRGPGTGTRPGPRSGFQPGGKPAWKSGGKPGGKPNHRPGGKPFGPKTGGKPFGPKPGGKPFEKKPGGKHEKPSSGDTPGAMPRSRHGKPMSEHGGGPGKNKYAPRKTGKGQSGS